MEQRFEVVATLLKMEMQVIKTKCNSSSVPHTACNSPFSTFAVLFLFFLCSFSPKPPSLSFFHPLLHLAPLTYIFSQPQARLSVIHLSASHDRQQTPQACAHTPRNTHRYRRWDQLGADGDESGLEKCHRELS